MKKRNGKMAKSQSTDGVILLYMTALITTVLGTLQ